MVGREKRDWGYQGRWLFDELSKPDHNPNHAKFETVVSRSLHINIKYYVGLVKCHTLTVAAPYYID